MPASKRHVNWSNVEFSMTSPSVSTVAITGVQGIDIDHRGSLLSHSGDAERMPTVKVSDYEDPMVTVTHRDLNAARTIPIGARGTLTADHHDAKNGMTAAGGGYTMTLAGAIVGNKTSTGQHRQFGQGTLPFEAESTDGQTNPLSYAAA